MKPKFDASCFVGTTYSLLVYLLLEPAPIDRTFFILTSGISEKIRSRLKNCVLADRSLLLAKIAGKRGFFNWILWKNGLRGVPVYGHAHDIYGGKFWLYRNKNPLFLIEDGVDNYTFTDPAQNSPAEWYGATPRVSKIFLTGMLPIPDVIAPKVQLISLQKLWDAKPAGTRSEIARIFDVERFLGNEFLQKSHDSALLLPQPFSEDGHLSEAEKIKLFRYLVAKFAAGTHLIIKPHPREKTDYSQHFPNATILRTTAPIELLGLMGVLNCRGMLVLTVSSGAVKNPFFAQSKILEFPDWNPEILTTHVPEKLKEIAD